MAQRLLSVGTSQIKLGDVFMFLILNLLCSSLGYADLNFSRTAQSSLNFEGTENAAVYRTECQTTEHYGQHSSCGSYESCSQSFSSLMIKSEKPIQVASLDSVIRDHRDHRDNGPIVRDHRDDGPIVRDHRDGHSGGGSSSDWSSGSSSSDSSSDSTPVTTCHTVYNSCTYSETNCYQVVDHYVPLKVELSIDHKAVVPPGMTESLSISLGGSGTARTFEVRAAGSPYGYTLQGDVSVNLNAPKNVYVLSAMMTRVKPPVIENQIKVWGAGYTARGSFQIHFTDPLLAVPELRRAVYKIEVKQGKHKRIAGTFTSAKLERRLTSYMIEVEPGETEWLSYPDERSKDLFILSMQVRPETYFLKNDYSKAKLSRLLKPFP